MSWKEPDLYYVQNRIASDFVLWWRINGQGYTHNLQEAGLFTAEQVAKMRPGEDVAWPWREVQKIATAATIVRHRDLCEQPRKINTPQPAEWVGGKRTTLEATRP